MVINRHSRVGRIKTEGTHKSDAETVIAGEFGNESYLGTEKMNIIILSECLNLRSPLIYKSCVSLP